MQVKINQLIEIIPKLIQAKLVPLISGSPGIGKSDVARQVAEKYNLKVIDLRLSQCDPTDLLGFPSINGSKAGYVPMETFPVEGDPIPEGYAGWLLFLDELTSAVPAVQAASYKLTLDRMVGQSHLHKNVAIVAAGNLETDGAIVHEMSTALQSRLVHFEMVMDPDDWCDWAMAKGIDHRITDFIKFKPSALYTFTADHTDKTYACPRTWEFTNRLLKVFPTGDKNLKSTLAGTISEGVAAEFLLFMKVYERLPRMADIKANPETVAVPDEPSILYALTGSLSHNMTPDAAAQLMKYVSRLPVEFQVVTLRDTVRRNKEMMQNPAISKWISESSARLF